jgi:AcrR family transcriptional regulator
MSQPAKRNRRTHDREATEAALLKAFEAVLMRDGYHRMSISAVAEDAGIDRVLIYRYFTDLAGLADQWARRSEFWPTELELIGGDPDAFAQLSVHERIKAVMLNFIDAIRKRPIAAQALIAEVINPNDIGKALEQDATRHGQDVGLYIKPDSSNKILMDRIWRLIVLVRSVTFYWCIRSINNPVFLEMDLRQDESWNFLKQTIHDIVDCYLPRDDSRRSGQ